MIIEFIKTADRLPELKLCDDKSMSVAGPFLLKVSRYGGPELEYTVGEYHGDVNLNPHGSAFCTDAGEFFYPAEFVIEWAILPPI